MIKGKRKRCTAVALCSSLLCSCAACGGGTGEESSSGKQGTSWLQALNSYPDDKELLIGAHGQPASTAEAYREAKEMGLTFLFLTEEKTDAVFTYAQEAGLKTILSLGNTLASFKGVDWSKDWSVYPHNFAVDYFDEPNAQQFDMLAEWTERHHEKYEGARPLFWVNLLPIDASDLLGTTAGEGVKADERYVKEYCEKVLSGIGKEAILSYDYYPLRAMYDKGEFEYNYVADEWLRTMEVTAKYAKQYGVSTHAYIQTCGFYKPDPAYHSWICRKSDEKALRFQLYCSMAYGIRNFTHFTYSTSEFYDSHGYTEACIGRDGSKTQLYTDAQKVNRELLEFDHIYLSFAWKGTMTAVGGNNLADDPGYTCAAYELCDYSLHALSLGDATCTENTLIGQFRDEENGRDALMLANYTDPEQGLSDLVTLTLEEGIRSLAVYRLGEWKEYKPNAGRVEIELGPGEGAFAIAL